MANGSYDCIVIGAGHAGVEAAHAAARLGAATALVTFSRQAIARASCNPAIGGLAKGQIVREVDALGGLMGLAADATGIQYRLLNRSRGPAVRSPRAQIDKYMYSSWVSERLQATENLTIIEGAVTEISTEGGRVTGVGCADGRKYTARAVVVATGTFLRGLMHLGNETTAGGRLGEPASDALSDCLKGLGLSIGRLKTGTPPRLDASTVDFEKLEVQNGDQSPKPFSFMTDSIDRPQIPCWITYTNQKIHQLLTENLDRAPLYSGRITSTGPRYCPSIEVKIRRFPEKPRHQVFLEPEQRDVSVIYCNGISTSVPRDVQERMLQLLPGTERARIIHYGYAIEYDYCPPVQLRPSLRTRSIGGLFLAGQINGTSGYEEAAGQGLIAGINAAMEIQDRPPLILGRDQAYIGVMIDDLLTKGIDEPYRMFTSRAEYRLSLRSDNADRRLTPIGRQVGLVDDSRWNAFSARLARIEKFKDYLKTTRPGSKTLWSALQTNQAAAIEKNISVSGTTAIGTTPDEIETVVTDARYHGYLERQEKLVAAFRGLAQMRMPDDLDYRAIEHLKAEAREKLDAFRPATLAQAARISGITPADITVLQIHLKKRTAVRRTT